MVIPNFQIQNAPDLFKANVGRGAQIAIQGLGQLQRANEADIEQLYKIKQAENEANKILKEKGFRVGEDGKIVFDPELFKIQTAAENAEKVKQVAAESAAREAEKTKGAAARDLFQMSQPKTEVKEVGNQLFQITNRQSPRGPVTETTPLTEPVEKKFSEKGRFRPTAGGGVLDTSSGEYLVEPHGMDEGKMSDIDKEELKGLRQAIQAAQFDPAAQSKALLKYSQKIASIRAASAPKAESGTIPEFKTEAEAIASGKKGKVKIGGRLANID